MGGFDGSDSKGVDVLDLESCVWRQPAALQLSVARSEAAGVALEGLVYLVGGTSYGRELELLERCDGESWEACEWLGGELLKPFRGPTDCLTIQNSE